MPNYTDSQMLAQLDTMVLAGSETSALTLATTVLALAMFPDFQNNVFEEVLEVMPDKNQSIEYEELQKLEYTEMTLKETLRLMPITHLLGRNVDEDVQVGEKVIPKGVYAVIYLCSSVLKI